MSKAIAKPDVEAVDLDRLSRRCPTNPRFPGDIVGCGSSNVTDPDEDGLCDCLECGIWFKPALELDSTNSTAPAGCAPPLSGSEGVLHVNFGVYRRVRRRTENKCGKLTIAGTWGDAETHRAIRAKISELNPGWDVQGYCLSEPQPRSSTNSPALGITRE